MPRFSSEHQPNQRKSQHAILTEEDVKLIRELLDEADKLRIQIKVLTVKAIAEKFDVSESAVRDIKKFRTWQNVY